MKPSPGISPQKIFSWLGDAQIWMALAFMLDQTSKRVEVVATFRPPATGTKFLEAISQIQEFMLLC